MTAVAATAPPVHHQAPASAWLAAFALGLAYSQRPRPELIAELRDAADSHTQLLNTAAARLAQIDVAEPTVRHEALELLQLAAHQRPCAC